MKACAPGPSDPKAQAFCKDITISVFRNGAGYAI